MVILANVFQDVWNWATTTEFLKNTTLNWFKMLGCVLLGMVIGKIVSLFLFHHAEKVTRGGKFKILGMFIHSMGRPVLLFSFSVGLYCGGTTIRMLPDIRVFYEHVCETIGAIAVLWFIFKLVDIVEIMLKHMSSKTETTLDDQLIPLVRKALRVFVIIIGLLYIATIFDQNIGTLLAGLGLGGLALIRRKRAC